VSEQRTIHLPAELCGEVEERFSGRFANLEQLLECVLRELLRDEATRVDQQEQRLVEQRLRDLGYI
jgi:hypothetical protein